MVGGGGGLQDFSVSPRPLGLGFLGFWVWGLRVWGQGLTIDDVLLEHGGLPHVFSLAVEWTIL